MPEYEATESLSNRINVFRKLTTDELNSTVNQSIFTGLLGEYYDEFVAACDFTKSHADEIDSISCEIVGGKINFSYNYKDE